MKKLADLRAHLTKALPILRRQPELLQLFADEGAIACTLAAGLTYRTAYKITGQLWDFADHPDAVWVPLLDWIARNQPELLASSKTNATAINWRAELLDANKVDLEFSFSVTEVVQVQIRSDGKGADVVHVPGPKPDHADVRRWSLWVADDLVAEWDAPADQLSPWPVRQGSAA